MVRNIRKTKFNAAESGHILQPDSINLTLRADCVAEQLQSFLRPEDGLEKKKRGTYATVQQLVGYRRRPENIMADMLDKMSRQKKASKEELIKRSSCGSKDESKKSNRRRRRRPRILCCIAGACQTMA